MLKKLNLFLLGLIALLVCATLAWQLGRAWSALA